MKELVRQVVERTLDALQVAGTLRTSTRPAFSVEHTKQAAHGDYACNVAMLFAKLEGRPPRELAQTTAAALVDSECVIAKVEVAGPGFLNFTLTDVALSSVLRTVLARGAAWGRAEARTGQRILFEYVSANPTGPIHIGHARGAFVGDALARLLDAAGHDVVKEFYVNDYGRQVETLGRTVLKRYRQLFGVEVELAEGEYPGEYVVDIARTLKEEDGDRWLAANDEDALARSVEVAIRENLKLIRQTLKLANIEHDVYFSEASLHASGTVSVVVEAFRARGATYEADQAREMAGKVRRDESKASQFVDRQLGGTFLATSTEGDEEDRIIQRRDGTPVYLTADLAYHKGKFDRGFDRCIDVLGADHSGHVPRIRAGMRLLGIDDSRLDFVLVQMVRILRDGQGVKLSKRKGTVLELADLLEEVGADACRFIFLMKSPNSQMDFDLGLARKQSAENPVFYLQYGHARCAQILAKASTKGQAFRGLEELTDAMLTRLTLPEERLLMKKMSLLPEVVQRAAQSLEPHVVLYFCQELVAEFHGYYSKYARTEPVIGDDFAKTQARLALVSALRQTLKSAFEILGVSAPDRMDSSVADLLEVE